MSSKRKNTRKLKKRGNNQHTVDCEASLTLWNLPPDFSCVTLPASHCYSVPMLVSLSRTLVSFLLTHWSVVQELSSSVHAGVAAVWRKHNMKSYDTTAIMKNHLIRHLKTILKLQTEKNSDLHLKLLLVCNSNSWNMMNINLHQFIHSTKQIVPYESCSSDHILWFNN